jgi:hypothetical protein
MRRQLDQQLSKYQLNALAVLRGSASHITAGADAARMCLLSTILSCPQKIASAAAAVAAATVPTIYPLRCLHHPQTTSNNLHALSLLALNTGLAHMLHADVSRPCSHPVLHVLQCWQVACRQWAAGNTAV